MDFKNMKWLKLAVPPLAREFGLSKEVAWELLAKKASEIKELISETGRPETRKMVNLWWDKYYCRFLEFGLGKFRLAKRASCIGGEEDYQQLICLAFLEKELDNEISFRKWEEEWEEKRKKKTEVKIEPISERISFWQQAVNCFKNIFTRGGKIERTKKNSFGN